MELDAPEFSGKTFSGFLSFGHSLLPQAVLPATLILEKSWMKNGFDTLPNPFFIHQCMA
jgi:hypothetical protein